MLLGPVGTWITPDNSGSSGPWGSGGRVCSDRPAASARAARPALGSIGAGGAGGFRTTPVTVAGGTETVPVVAGAGVGGGKPAALRRMRKPPRLIDTFPTSCASAGSPLMLLVLAEAAVGVSADSVPPPPAGAEMLSLVCSKARRLLPSPVVGSWEVVPVGAGAEAVSFL